MQLADAVSRWARTPPRVRGRLAEDAAALSAWHDVSSTFLAGLAARGQDAALARLRWRQQVRAAHTLFIQGHREELFRPFESGDVVGGMNVLRQSFPGLLATPRELEEDARRMLPEKIGHEYKTALVLSALLGAANTGRRLIERARRPGAAALDRLAAFEREGALDLGKARIFRDGSVAHIELVNPGALNSEDESVLEALETCVDIALLDDRVQLGALRGAPVQNRKYAGQRVFCSGIDLSGIYDGKLSYGYYVRRELGLVAKLYRGLLPGDGRPEVEKPWIGAVDTHAIGGGLQLLLVLDYVIATRGAIFSLPARTEGIIPGAANLRLARFIGGRAARRAVLMGGSIACDSEAGRSLVDEVVEPGDMGSALRAAADTLLSSGLVSLAGNRRALRIAEEPAHQFQEYMAHFAIAQADCHFSSELVHNLEAHWLTRRRTAAGQS